jgi:hypothetical protein
MTWAPNRFPIARPAVSESETYTQSLAGQQLELDQAGQQQPFIDEEEGESTRREYWTLP